MLSDAFSYKRSSPFSASQMLIFSSAYQTKTSLLLVSLISPYIWSPAGVQEDVLQRLVETSQVFTTLSAQLEIAIPFLACKLIDGTKGKVIGVDPGSVTAALMFLHRYQIYWIHVGMVSCCSWNLFNRCHPGGEL